MPTREQEFARVRSLLDHPKEQRPNPLSIVTGLLRQDQLMNNRLTNTGRGWDVGNAVFTSVPGLAEYTLENATPGTFSKALYAFRIVGDNILLPVPFTDFTSEIDAQSYEFRQLPVTSGAYPSLAGEKLAFFRSGGLCKVRIFPVPTEARDYNVVSCVGARSYEQIALGDSPSMPEYSDYRCIAVALFELPKAEWDGFTREENREKRKELAASLQVQFQMHEAEFSRFIRNPQHEPPSDFGYWWQT